MADGLTGVSATKLALAVSRRRGADADADLALSEPIAVIGIGCRYPGGITTPDELWARLLERADLVREIPPGRWPVDQWFDPDPKAPGRTNGRWGSFLEDVEGFDPAFFGIAPREAPSMDPQQRVLLEVVWEALAEAGIAPDALAGSATGMFVGICNMDYSRRLFSEPSSIGPNSLTGASFSIASGRISYLLDLQGPSISIDTACSSSLVAIHLACQSLRLGECRLALAGGVTLHTAPEHYLSLAKLGMLSPTGQCRAFDAGANGFVPGEGCGVVVLKRLADALAAGDRIHAVVRGTASVQDGRTNVLTAPNGLAQQAVIRAALANGRVEPSQIGFVETHGTGTALGDPIEVEALAEVLTGSAPCALGAVKSNMGHLEAAAGVTGFIKAVLTLERESIPANLHFNGLNPHIDLTGTRFVIPIDPIPWPRREAPRFAAVSSFGFGGTNAHAVLEEAPRLPPAPVDPGPVLLPVSARTDEALRILTTRFETLLESDPAPGPIAATAASGRSHFSHRVAVVGATAAELARGLAAPRVPLPEGAEVDRPVFVCSGQGSQWARMGLDLLGHGVFRATLEACDEAIARRAGWSLLALLEAGEAESRLGHTVHAQPAIFALQLAIARLLQSWGIEPAAVIGHSVGEVAAACLAGALTLDESIRLVVSRGRLMEEATGSGRMAAVALPAAEVEGMLAEFGEALSLAASNGPASSVVSGTADAVERITSRWREDGTWTRLLPVDYAFHSVQMESISRRLVAELGAVAIRPGTIPMFSTVTGSSIRGADLDAVYWGRNVRRTVRFRDAVDAAIDAGHRTFVEIAPHAVLSQSLTECLAGKGLPHTAVPTLRRNQDGVRGMLSALGALYERGATVAWSALYPGRRQVVTLPAHPYLRQRYWHELPAQSGQVAWLRPLLERRLRTPGDPGISFQSELSISRLGYLGDHRIAGAVILPMTGFLELVFEAVRELEPDRAILALEDVAIERPIRIPDTGARLVQVSIRDDRFEIHALADDQAWQRCATGTIAEGRTDPFIAPVETLAEESVDQFYRRAADRGAAFGPSFQLVRTLRAGPATAAATVRLGDPDAELASRYEIHPALLDGCLQPLLATGAAGDETGWIPVGLRRCELYSRGAGSLSARVRVAPDGSGALLVDSVAVDEHGAPVVVCSGVRFNRLGGGDPSARFRFRIRWRPVGRARSADGPAGPMLVVGWPEGVASIAADLKGRGVAVESTSPEALSDGPGSIEASRLIYVAPPAEPGVADEGLRDAFESIRRYLATAVAPVSVIAVTRKAERAAGVDAADGFALATIGGMLRSVRHEHPAVGFGTVDIDQSVGADDLAAELIGWDGEERVALRGSERLVARLEQAAPDPDRHEPRRIAIPARGSLENLRLERITRRVPGPDEIEVAVDAAGLNFRDVLNALGMYPGEAGLLGAEFVGRVVRVGPGVVDFSEGDRVMGIGWGSLASHVTTSAAMVVPAPADLDPVAAATIPNAFVTAHYCLVEVARLRAGERVLVHAGAGGVGGAAIQVALALGAEVFATAGSEEKRAYLRSIGVRHVFDSRVPDFADPIRKATGGRGVDVVLNSLSGDFIPASFASLGDEGRFVEIGKRGTWSVEQVAALGRSIGYTIVDLGVFIDAEPAVIGSQLRQVAELLGAGRIHPLPHRVFELGGFESAFRFMAEARHLGKVVVRMAARFEARGGTYLITGGLGGLGLAVARWLAERGAGELVLAGRSVTPAADSALAAIRSLGSEVQAVRLDVTDRAAVEELVGRLRVSERPLRGVIHAAGVVDDGVFTGQDWDRYARVLAPKVAGAWHLHQALRGVPLEFLVLFSSVSAVLGAPGQSGYTAANAYMDGLAGHRRRLGGRTLSINWGAWSDAGMAARVEAAGRKRVLEAIRPLGTDQCLDALEAALVGADDDVVVAAVAWDRWDGPVPSVLRDLIAAPAAAVRAEPSLAARLEAAPRHGHRGILLEAVRQEARRVVGLAPAHPIDERQPLLRLGLDSLMAVEFRNRLAAGLGRPLPATLLFDHPSATDIVDFLLGMSGTAPDEDPMLREVAELSDEEAERLLERELGRG